MYKHKYRTLPVLHCEGVCDGGYKRKHLLFFVELNGPRREKTCLPDVANNTGADQPAHPISLISAFVIRFLQNTICKLTSGEISIF